MSCRDVPHLCHAPEHAAAFMEPVIKAVMVFPFRFRRHCAISAYRIPLKVLAADETPQRLRRLTRSPALNGGYRVVGLGFQLNVCNLFDADYVASSRKATAVHRPGEPEPFLLRGPVPYDFLLECGARIFGGRHDSAAFPAMYRQDCIAALRERNKPNGWMDVTTGTRCAS